MQEAMTVARTTGNLCGPTITPSQTCTISLVSSLTSGLNWVPPCTRASKSSDMLMISFLLSQEIRCVSIAAMDLPKWDKYKLTCCCVYFFYSFFK